MSKFHLEVGLKLFLYHLHSNSEFDLLQEDEQQILFF